MWRDPLGYVMRLCLACLLLIALYDVVVSMLRALLRTISEAGGSSTVAVHSAGRAAPVGGGQLFAVLVGTVVVLGIAIVVHLGLLRWLRRWYRSHTRGPRPKSRGARYATVRQLRRAGLLRRDGWPLGSVRGRLGRRYVVRLPPEREREGVLVCAATGSGKNISLLVPAILSETLRSGKRRSIVIVDPASELTPLTIGALSRTHRVLVWNPSDPCASPYPGASAVTFDPLLTLPSPDDDRYSDEVQQLADEHFHIGRSSVPTTNQRSHRESYWDEQGRIGTRCAYFTYLALYPDGTFVDFANWIRRLEFQEFVNRVAESGSAEAMDYLAQLRSLTLNDRGVGSIWPDILEKFAFCKGPRVQNAMGTTAPVDWRAFVRKPTALYILVNEGDADRLRPVVSLFLGRLYRELRRLASERRTRCLEREVRVFCDELGNISHVFGLAKALATLRKRGVGHYAALQTTTQLSPLYGEDEAKTILGNLVTKIYLGGVSLEDGRAISEQCGEITEYVPMDSYRPTGLFRGGEVTHQYQPDRRSLISASDIIHLGREAIISTRGVPPIRLTLRRYMDDPEMRDLVPEGEDPPDPDEADEADELADEAWA